MQKRSRNFVPKIKKRNSPDLKMFSHYYSCTFLLCTKWIVCQVF